MIHLVVALPAEADPLIERLGLQRDPSARASKLYVGEAARLLVSGVGRRAAAEAVESLRRLGSEDDPLWANVGIGAHRSLPLGQLVVVEAVVGAGEDRWQPLAVHAPDLPTATVVTVDRPQRDLDDDRLYDMEAAGFLPALSSRPPERRIACLKVVSDRGADSPGELTRAQVRALVGRNAGRIERLLRAAVELGVRAG